MNSIFKTASYFCKAFLVMVLGTFGFPDQERIKIGEFQLSGFSEATLPHLVGIAHCHRISGNRSHPSVARLLSECFQDKLFGPMRGNRPALGFLLT